MDESVVYNGVGRLQIVIVYLLRALRIGVISIVFMSV